LNKPKPKMPTRMDTRRITSAQTLNYNQQIKNLLHPWTSNEQKGTTEMHLMQHHNYCETPVNLMPPDKRHQR